MNLATIHTKIIKILTNSEHCDTQPAVAKLSVSTLPIRTFAYSNAHISDTEHSVVRYGYVVEIRCYDERVIQITGTDPNFYQTKQ